jgi:hypothetical protein
VSSVFRGENLPMVGIHPRWFTPSAVKRFQGLEFSGIPQ